MWRRLCRGVEIERGNKEVNDSNSSNDYQRGNYTDTGRAGALSGDNQESESNELEATANRDATPQTSGLAPDYAGQDRDDVHASGQSIDFSGTQLDSDFEPD